MNYRDLFSTLGLSDKELSVFLTLMDMWPQKVSALAKALDMPRSTVQFIIGKLTEAGLVEMSEGRGIKTCRTVDARLIQRLFRQRRNRMHNALKECESQIRELEGVEYAGKDPLPAVHWVEGREAVMRRHMRLASRHGDKGSQCLVYDPQAMNAVMPGFNDPLLYKQGDTSYRELIVDTPFARAYASVFKDMDRVDIRILPPGFFFTSNVSIMDKSEVRLSVLDETESDCLSVSLKNEQIAEQLQSIFEYLWETVVAEKT